VSLPALPACARVPALHLYHRCWGRQVQVCTRTALLHINMPAITICFGRFTQRTRRSNRSGEFYFPKFWRCYGQNFPHRWVSKYKPSNPDSVVRFPGPRKSMSCECQQRDPGGLLDLLLVLTGSPAVNAGQGRSIRIRSGNSWRANSIPFFPSRPAKTA